MATSIGIGDVNVELKPPPYTKEQIAEVHIKAANEFTNPAVQNALQLELDKFTATSKLVYDLFSTVEAKLEEFDKKGYSKTPLATDWKKLRLEFRTLLWNSRDLATEIAVSSEQFTTAILPLATSVNTTGPMSPQTIKELENVIATIDWYIGKNETNATNAKNQANAFKELQTKVNNFSADFDKFGQDLIDKNKLTIEGIKTSITTLEAELKSWNIAIVAAGAAFGLALLLSAACAFIPGVGWTIAAVGLGVVAAGAAATLGVAVTKANGINKDISEKKAEMRRLEAENVDILATRAKLHDLRETSIAQIVTGLGSFEQIWNAVNSDCVSIKKYLSDVKDAAAQPNSMPMIMVVYLKNANTLYVGLTKALRLYASGIANSGLPAKT